jgi:hypothetical protein
MRIALLVAALAVPAAAQDAVVIVATAPKPSARGTPVEAALPADSDPSRPWKLTRVQDGKEVPVQVLPGKPSSAVWLLEEDLAAGAKREYRLQAAAPSPFPAVECRDVEGRHLLVRAGGKDVLRYNHATVQPPPGVADLFARSGYLHPVWTPGGRVITNDFPAKHLHHHGIWFAWTSAEFEGRKSDFWNSKEKQGKIECVKVEETFSGPVFAGFRARHRFVNLNGPDGPRPALDETWEVRVYALSDAFLFDLRSAQTCATKVPLSIKKYYYGGLGFRGSGQWEGKEGVSFLTSEGKGRTDGNATTGRWCVLKAPVDGQVASIGFLGHPSNFRAPQGMRLHPDEPFFNWAPSQGGDFQIEPAQTYVSRYRFLVRDGPLTAEEMDRAWNGYADPPAAAPAK